MAKRTLFLTSRGDGRMTPQELAQAQDLAKDVPQPSRSNPFARQGTVAIIAPGIPGGGGSGASGGTSVSGAINALVGDVIATGPGAAIATVVGFNGVALSGTLATVGQVYQYNGTVIAPAFDVVSLNGLNGGLSVAGVSGITVGQGGSNLTVGIGTYVSSLNSLFGALSLVAGNTNITISPGGTAVTISGAAGGGGGDLPFPLWSGGPTYTAGNVVQGSDGNLYRAVGSNNNNNPITDSGTNWQLWYLYASVTLNCGAGQRFAGTTLTDPAGIIQAYQFIRACSGAMSPDTATITIQIANNGTFTIASGASTTSFTSNAQINIGTTLLYSSGTGGNSGKSCRITAVSGSGPYTYTSDNGGGSTGLGSTPANGDVFTVDYGYGTNQIAIKLPIIGPNVIISGSTSTVTVPLLFPTISDGGTSGTFAATPIYVAYSYTWSAGGATQETIPGFISTFTPTLNHKITLASFTVPTGVTGVNVYISTSNQGALSTFHLQATAFTISGGTAQTLTLAGNTTGGAAPKTANPVAAAYPSALSWASTLAIPAIKLSNTPGMQIEDLYSYGNLNSTNLAAAIEIFECNGIRFGANLILSSFYQGVYAVASRMYLNTVQVDAVNQVCFASNEYCLMAFNGNCAAYGGLFGYVCGYTSQFIYFSTGIEDPSNTYQMVAYRSSTDGFLSQWGSNMRIPTVTTNGQQTWNVGTTYSPTSGTNANHDAWLEIS